MKIKFELELDVPKWATHVAIDRDGEVIVMGDTRHGIEFFSPEASDFDGSWTAAMQNSLEVKNWKDTLVEVSNEMRGEDG